MRRVWFAFGCTLVLGCPASETSSEVSSTGSTSASGGDSSPGPMSTGSPSTTGQGDASSGEAESGSMPGETTSDPTGDPEPSHLTPGCGQPATGAVLDGVITVAGQERDYLIEVPADYDPETPYPLIFGFHGDGSDNVQAQATYRLFEYYDGQAIAVYPNGSGAGGSPGWSTTNGGEDVELVIALAQEIGLEMCFDLRRVHAYGYSRGAAMAHAIGCYRGDLFTGVGASSGWAPSTGLCQRPTAVFMSHGLTDDRVPFVTGRNARDAWADYNGCDEATTELEDGCIEYQGCDAGAPVRWCEFDGGHQFNTEQAERAVRLFQTL